MMWRNMFCCFYVNMYLLHHFTILKPGMFYKTCIFLMKNNKRPANISIKLISYTFLMLIYAGKLSAETIFPDTRFRFVTKIHFCAATTVTNSVSIIGLIHLSLYQQSECLKSDIGGSGKIFDTEEQMPGKLNTMSPLFFF